MSQPDNGREAPPATSDTSLKLSKIPNLIRTSLAAKHDYAVNEEARLNGLKSLQRVMKKQTSSNVSNSVQATILSTYFSAHPRAVWRWSTPWNELDDVGLLIGAYRYGHDQWAAIAADQELGLSGKVFIGSPNRVPNETVLKRRLDYLLSLLISSPSPSPSPAPSPSPSPQTSATLTRTLPVREALSRQWTEAAREAGAAPITFANNVDKEDLPPGLESFRYLENTFDQ